MGSDPAVSVQELYEQAIKALAAAGEGQGRLDAPDARALLDNPLCGDRVEIEVKLSAGRIAAIAHAVKGCLLCRAAAGAIGLRATGASAGEIARVAAQLTEMLEHTGPPPDGWPELAAFAPVHGHRSRYGCVLLPFNTLIAALRPDQTDS
ncbi:MAG: iron-sulfur cluster assembly scaffold protein [Betaproteobacteria bacterium]|nr:iron-sulfur cluster assembly scaffold protein [Betaproteobacteria bacterium]